MYFDSRDVRTWWLDFSVSKSSFKVIWLCIFLPSRLVKITWLHGDSLRGHSVDFSYVERYRFEVASCPLNPNFLSVFRIILTHACLEQTWLPAFYNNEHWITVRLSWRYRYDTTVKWSKQVITQEVVDAWSIVLHGKDQCNATNK